VGRAIEEDVVVEDLRRFMLETLQCIDGQARISPIRQAVIGISVRFDFVGESWAAICQIGRELSVPPK
jgi:hypothetical protein